jgi:DNA-binding NtrC family response regulator
MRILIVDDDGVVRSVAAAMLAAQGHECEVALTAMEGIERAQNEQFDVALIDMVMPGLHGLEAVKEIAHMSPPLPVIAMSAGSPSNTPEDFEVLALRMGAGAFLAKPFDATQLMQAIATVCETGPGFTLRFNPGYAPCAINGPSAKDNSAS